MNKTVLFGEFAKDVWDLKQVNDTRVRKLFQTAHDSNRILNFNGVKNNDLKHLLKLFMHHILTNTNLSTDTYKYHYFKPLKEIVVYLQQHNTLEDLLEENFINEKHKTFINKFSEYQLRFAKENKQENDIWFLEDFNIAEKRLNKTSSIKSFSFVSIKNPLNKKLVKKYIKRKIEHSTLSISYIRKELSNIIEFESVINKSFDTLTRSDIEHYLYSIKDQSKELRSSKIGKIKKLMEFLVSENVVQSVLFQPQDYAKAKKTLNIRLVEDETVNQIYKKLDKLEPLVSRMFLILSNCGLRISEVCLLGIDSIEKTSSGTYLKIYQQKMKKYITNPIPEQLFNILEVQQHEMIEKFGKEHTYLFSIKKMKPIRPRYFTDRMREFCVENEIKKSTGEIYDFKCHDFRHTFATKLLQNDIPYHIIQRLLGHKSIEMTMSYTEIDDNRRKEKYRKFVNIQGTIKSLTGDVEVTDEEFEMQWLKKNINYQTLPNGMCALPIGLGTCPHSNSCLTCEKYFRTSEEHLPVLKKQLEKTREVISISEENGWFRQVANNKKIEENLLKIISNLE